MGKEAIAQHVRIATRLHARLSLLCGSLKSLIFAAGERYLSKWGALGQRRDGVGTSHPPTAVGGTFWASDLLSFATTAPPRSHDLSLLPLVLRGVAKNYPVDVQVCRLSKRHCQYCLGRDWFWFLIFNDTTEAYCTVKPD